MLLYDILPHTVLIHIAQYRIMPDPHNATWYNSISHLLSPHMKPLPIFSPLTWGHRHFLSPQMRLPSFCPLTWGYSPFSVPTHGAIPHFFVMGLLPISCPLIWGYSPFSVPHIGLFSIFYPHGATPHFLSPHMGSPTFSIPLHGATPFSIHLKRGHSGSTTVQSHTTKSSLV